MIVLGKKLFFKLSFMQKCKLRYRIFVKKKPDSIKK